MSIYLLKTLEQTNLRCIMKGNPKEKTKHILWSAFFVVLSLVIVIFPELFASKHQVISAGFVAIFTLAAAAYYGYLGYLDTLAEKEPQKNT